MSYLGWFDGELLPDAWFDAELQPAGWWDTEIILASSGSSGAVNYYLACDVTAYSLVPIATTLRVSRNLALSPVAYALAPIDAALTYVSGVSSAVDYTLGCDAVGYSLTTIAVTFQLAHNLALDTAVYSYVPQGINLGLARNVPLATVNYALTPQDIALGVARNLPLSVVAYSLTPVAAALAFSRNLPLAPISYLWTVQDAMLAKTGATFPAPSDVLQGVMYGPTGMEFTGTYVDQMRIEITTGSLIKPLGSKLALML